jgi:hypothetical protein
MDWVKATDGDPVLDRASSQPKRLELPIRHHAVLAIGQRCDCPVDPTFPPYIGGFVGSIWHPADLDR